MTYGELKARLAEAEVADSDVLESLTVDLATVAVHVTRYEMAFDGYGPAWHVLATGRSSDGRARPA